MKGACEWFQRAIRDLRAAEILLEKELYEESAFHSQQAAEKALKAVLVALGIRPPRTHSIEQLLDMLSENEDVSPLYEIEADTLTDYAVAARYPGPAVVKEEASEALETARKVVEWARRELERMGVEC